MKCETLSRTSRFLDVIKEDRVMEPKSWEELFFLVASGIPSVRVAMEDMPKDVMKWLQDSTLELNAKADGCAAFFVKYGHWEKAEGDLRIMLFLRSIFACEAFHSRKNRAYHGPESHKTDLFLEHFLTAGWYHEWHGWAHLHFSGEWNLPFDPWN
ncbi:MAG: hypothetical protein V2A34_02555 [Lentisphaerota bacterium]